MNGWALKIFAQLGPVYMEARDPMQVGELTRLGGVTRRSIRSLILI